MSRKVVYGPPPVDEPVPLGEWYRRPRKSGPTDTEIAVRVAVDVMGWESSGEYWIIRHPKTYTRLKSEWNPCNDGNHAFEVLAEIERRGWGYSVTRKPWNTGHTATIYKAEGTKTGYGDERIMEYADDPRRAICLAALVAAGGGTI
jgi:hypothetical protein